MALLDDLAKGNAFSGLAIGLGVAVLGPIILPAAAKIAKPLAKAAIKAAILLYDKGRERAAEMEIAEDIVAEARVELEQEHQLAAVTANAKPAKGTRRRS